MAEETNPSSPAANPPNKWKLPDGIEDHIEDGLIKSAIGATVGGVFGMILFRSGGGMRSASVAAGVGAAVGSTYERFMSSQK
ncbi:unnamed protein product [Cylindrotheca closterium]|uniref:Glycine zipper 2TM domain-containing protein n=1 Tax=Cylindrotheca closterium TaxID=2856 RepID=A0AAD2PVG8_9STRA|nr:unnamed protein product [Cylindrotheca closterium]